jgi:hypothetical protein
MSEIEDIIVQHRIQKEDFKCIICLEFTHPPFYQCNGGLHFVCPSCYAKLSSDSCPSCRDNTLFNNKLLERDLTEYLVECPHLLCKKTVFEWDLVNHTDTCIYAASKCFFCGQIVNPEDFKSHIITQCERLDWVERNDRGTKGSLVLLSHLRWQCNGFKLINAHQLQSDFAVILNEMMLFAKREQDKWLLVVISPNATRVDAYFKHAVSKVCEIQSIVTIKSFRTCKELPSLEEMASFQDDLRTVEFVQSSVDREDEDSASLASDDEFFNGIIQRPI